MMATYSRWILAGILSCSLFALVFPMNAKVNVPDREMSCCAKAANHDSNNHCGGGPAKKQDLQCCAACWLCLTLLFVPTVSLRFPGTGNGERIAAKDEQLLSRIDQPPVPPPRHSLI
ncbi:MAG: hypothetical protein ABI925_06715 [Verrucomicrobiota bacterium]